MKGEREEIANKGIVIIGIVILSMLVVPFLLYILGVISKLTMTLIFLIPVTGLIVLIVSLKKRHLL